MTVVVDAVAQQLPGHGQTVCVTGAAGYIASWLVKLLLERGYTVKGTVRNPDDPKNAHLKALDGAAERLILCKADLLDYDAICAAVEGCHGVFHTASPVTDDPEQMVEPAVRGTEYVINAAADAGTVRRVVFTSSIGAVTMDPNRGPDVVVDESCWSDLEFCKKTKNWYCYGKAVAEQAAWERARKRGIDLVVVNPVLVVGPLLQPTVNASAAHILKYLDGSAKKYANAVQAYVDVRDVASAHVRVFEALEASGRYLCAESVLHHEDVVHILGKLFPEYPVPTRCSDEVNPRKQPYKMSIYNWYQSQFDPSQKFHQIFPHHQKSMAEESPIMRAWHEFAMADPEDCDREWEAYLALVGGKSVASVSSPTSSTSSQAPATATMASPTTSASAHPRVPCSAAAIAIPTVTAASPAVLRVKHDSPKDDLSPEARRMYDYLVGNSTLVSEESAPLWDQEDVYPPLAELRRAQMTDMQWAALSEWEKDLWEMKHLPEKERMNSIEGVVMWLPAAQRDQRRKELMEEILRFGEPAPTLDSSTTPTSTTSGISTVLQVHTELDGIPVAAITAMGSASARAVTSTHVPTAVALDSTPASVPTHETDPCSMMPTTCSTVCIGGDTSMTQTPSSTAAVPTSSASIPIPRAIVSATFMGPVVSDLLEGVDYLSSTSPFICLSMCPSGGIGTVASEACSVNSVLALGASSVSLTPPAYLVDDITAASATRLTNSAAALLSVKAFTVQKLIGALSQATKIKRPPWPPPWLVFFQDVVRCKDMIQVMLSDDLILESMPLMLWDAKIPGPLPFPNMSASIQNILQLDCQVIPFMPRTALFHLHVESVKFTRSRIGIGFCCFSSQVNMLFGLLLVRRTTCTLWISCCLDNLHGSLGSINWALEEEKGKVPLSVPWLSFRCNWVAAYPVMLWKLRTGHPHEGPDDFAGSFVLHWTSFPEENQMHLLTAAETFWCKLFSIGETEDCLQSEHLQQCRPPDQFTSLSCMGALFLSFKDYLSDIHWVQSTIVFFADLVQHERHTTEYLEVHNLLYRLTSSHFPAELFVIEHWLIPWKQSNEIVDHNLMENFTSLAITCELLSSISVDFWWCMRCVELDTEGPHNCVIFLQLKPPWSYLSPTIYVATHLGCQLFELQNPWYSRPCQGEMSSGIAIPKVDYTMVNWYAPFYAWMLLNDSCLQAGISLYLKGKPFPCVFELLQWKIAWTLVLESLTESNGNSANYSVVLTFTSTSYACVKEFHQGSLSDQTSRMFFAKVTTAMHIITYQLLLLVKTHGLGVRSTQVQDKIFGGKIISSQVYYSNEYSVLDITFLHTMTECSAVDLPWDPGGSLRHRLGGKPNLKREGLSATSLHSLLGWLDGPLPWAWPAREADEKANLKHICEGEQREVIGWELDGKAASAEAGVG